MSHHHHHVRDGRDHVRPISAELLLQELRSHRPLVIIDVRTHTDRKDRGWIASSRSMPMHQLVARRGELSTWRDQPLVVVSGDGNSARLGALELELCGFHEVRFLEGGMRGWNALGLPIDVTRPSGEARAPR